MTLSIVIPTFRDAAILDQTLASLRRHFDGEVVVVEGVDDGEDTAPCRAVVSAHGARYEASRKGRGAQLRRGADLSTGDTLLFSHTDTILPEGLIAEVERILDLPGTAAGAFQFRLDNPPRGGRMLERTVAWRSRFLQLPYGDQGLFLRRSTLVAAGGYPDLPAMEDFALARRLRRLGRVRLSPIAAITSGRKWRRRGLIRTTAVNQACIAAYYLRVDPNRIARWREALC